MSIWLESEEGLFIIYLHLIINAAAIPEISKSPAIDALLQQSEFASLQHISGAYWTPTLTFGGIMAAGNPENTDLQVLLDQMTKEITAS